MEKRLKTIGKIAIIILLIIPTITIAYTKTATSEKSTSISIINTDESGRELLGGEIQVLKEDGTVVEQWTAKANSPESISLKPGTYIIKQIVAPVGYSVTEEEIKLLINKKGIATVNGEKVNTIKIMNINNGFYACIKDKENNNILEGATLIIKNKNNTEVIKFTTKANHQMIKGIPEGEYTLTEIAPPNGYQINTEAVSFKIDTDGRIIDKDGFNISELAIYNEKIK